MATAETMRQQAAALERALEALMAEREKGTAMPTSGGYPQPVVRGSYASPHDPEFTADRSRLKRALEPNRDRLGWNLDGSGQYRGTEDPMYGAGMGDTAPNRQGLAALLAGFRPPGDPAQPQQSPGLLAALRNPAAAGTVPAQPPAMPAVQDMGPVAQMPATPASSPAASMAPGPMPPASFGGEMPGNMPPQATPTWGGQYVPPTLPFDRQGLPGEAGVMPGDVRGAEQSYSADQLRGFLARLLA